MEWAFLALSPARDKLLVFGIHSDYFVLVFNGSDPLVVSGRNNRATWRPTYALGSRERALYELQNGRKFRTWPPGLEHEINWHDPYTQEHYDHQASALKSFVPGPRVPPILASRQIDVSIEIEFQDGEIEISEGEIPFLPSPPADAPAAARPSVKWARKTTRRLLTESKVPEKARKNKAEFARFLAAESQKAVKAGQLSRVLKASYIENQLGKDKWGIWPLDSFK
jgi:hypothetical protein